MKHSSVFLLVFLFGPIISPGLAQEILQWRGSDRSGAYKDSGLLKTWPAEGPTLLWESVDIGNGYGSPSITKNGIFVNGEIDSVSYLYALDLQGRLKWKTRIGKEWTQSYPGSRSTPTVVDDLVYVTAGWGALACIESATGKERWSLNLMSDFHGTNPRFGFSESVLIDGNTLYCSPGSPDTNVVALDRLTGKIIWISKGVGEITSYCSPVIVDFSTRRVLVTFSMSNMLGIDIRDGKLLWSYKQEGEGVDCQCNTPLYENGHLYCVSGNGNGAFKLRVSEDGSQITEVWKNNRCDNVFGGFIKVNDYLYTSGYEKRQYYIVETNTGTIVDSLKFDRGSTISADGHLYLYNEKGNLGLFRPAGPKLEQVCSFKVTRGTKAHFSHPVICGGLLYVRHGKSLLAYDIRDRKE